MTQATERNFKAVGNFTEEFHDWRTDKTVEGVFHGLITKEIDKEQRTFGLMEVQGKDKRQLVGGRDLLNKLANVKAGDYIRITFEGKDQFTPKGTKKKVNINRYLVEVAE